MSIETIGLKWVKNGSLRTIEAQDITTKIEIDDQKKEVKNAKKFFREIIFNVFYNDWDKKIELIDNEELEVAEIKALIIELVNLCNEELEKLKKEENKDVVQEEISL